MISTAHTVREMNQAPDAIFFPSKEMGLRRKIFSASGPLMMCQISQSCCKPIQNSVDIPNTRDRRKAVSGVTERRPLMISLRRGCGQTPNRRASSVCVSSRGLTNSSKSISPGWVGGRFRGSRQPRTLSVVVCDFDFVGMVFLPCKTNSVLLINSDAALIFSIHGTKFKFFKCLSWSDRSAVIAK